MIAHVGPRRVSVIGQEAGGAGFPVELDRILRVDLVPGLAGAASLLLHLTSGEQVVAARYARMDEAGRDCGRLRVLAGLPAWTGMEHAAPDAGVGADAAPDRPLAAPMALAAVLLLVATGLSGVFTPALVLLTSATSL